MLTLTYRMDHDLGFAPNPFFGWCSLACCKPAIRNKAEKNDLVIGMAGKSERGLGRYHPQVIYWMQVDEALSFDEFWSDQRFIKKRPILDACKVRAVGDNTYRKDPKTGKWLFEKSMHYVPGAPQTGGGHVVKDTKVDRLLLSQRFTYWGAKGPKVPAELMDLFPKTQGQKWHHTIPERLPELYQLINLDDPQGLVADPADWDKTRYFKPSTSK